MADEINQPEPENKKPKKGNKSKGFKSIEDILNIDGGDGVSFNAEVDAELETKADAAKKAVDEMRAEFNKIKELGDDEFSKSILKNLVERSMVMLASLQKEIEENPNGRAVETAAAMVSSISGLVDNFNKIKVYNEKLSIEREKLNMKKESMSAGALNGPAGNNTLVIADNNQIIELLAAKGILPSVSPKMKDATAEVVDIEKDEKDAD